MEFTNQHKGFAIIVGIALIITMVFQSLNTTSEDCRLDAINAMCKTYGNSSGGAKEVFGSNGGYTVVCDQDQKMLGWNVSQWNSTN